MYHTLQSLSPRAAIATGAAVAFVALAAFVWVLWTFRKVGQQLDQDNEAESTFDHPQHGNDTNHPTATGEHR